MSDNLGILHPGEMGISVADSAQRSGNTVFWVSEGRSPETRRRAKSNALADAGSLEALCRTCSIIISVCPPHAAEEVAQQVLAHAYRGLYVDANAISPQRAIRIGQAMAAQGIAFVDGGIIGGPAWEPDSTWLYLSGSAAERVADCFSEGLLQAEVIGEDIGKASALKMCYSAYSKGTAALLSAILSTAETLGVRKDLNRQWARGDPRFPEQTAQRVRRVTAKAWRFAGEMEEIAATFEAAGMPGGFHRAAADVYRRLAGFKDRAEPPPLADVLAVLGGGAPSPGG